MNTLHHFAMTAFLSLFCSCVALTPATTPNVPLLEKKGDVKMTGNLVISQGGGSGGSFQFAGSPAKNFYLGAAGSFLSYGDGANSTMMEIGAGGYMNISRSFRFDVAGGAGFGANKSILEYSNQRLYAQTAIAYVAPRIEIALGGKFNHTSFNEMKEHSFNMQTVDPFFMLRAGSPNVKFQLIGAYPVLLSSDEFVLPEATVSLGVQFKLGKKKGQQ